MEIIFSDHAILKITQRKLVKHSLLETVQTPDLVRSSRNLREERYKRFGKNWLKVVVIQEGVTTVIITAHWVAKVKKT